MYVSDSTGEHMPMWAPPTPPQDDNDLYVDQTMCFLYEPSTMPESQLPPVYVKKEHKRIRMDSSMVPTRKLKVRHKDEQPVRVPRSLFDRPMTALRREATKLIKVRPIKFGQKPPLGAQQQQPQLLPSRPMDPPQAEWLVTEDWALLQALQTLQELPLGLQANSPAHIANWDLVADVVNACSRTYRSAKQCRTRYESVIVPREEGKILYDINPRKQKKSKGIYKTKNNRPMRTSQIHAQDNNGALTTLFTLRFDSVKAIGSKRAPTLRPTLANPTLKNPKHAAVLAEGGINYEQPLTPLQVAAIRADRLAKEKKQQQQQPPSRGPTPQPTPTPTGQPQVATTVTVATTAGTVQVPMTIVQGTAQLTAQVATTATVMAGALSQKALQAGVPRSTTTNLGSIVVNAASSAFPQVNKRLGHVVQPTSVATSVAQVQQRQPQRASSTALTAQEVQALVSRNPSLRASTPPQQVITTATALSPAQLVAAQKGQVTVSSVASAVPQLTQVAGTKKFTQQQLLQISRQQAMLKQQQQQLRQGQPLLQQQQVSAATVSVGTVAQVQKTVSAPLLTSIAQVTGSQQQTPLQVAKPGLKQEEVAALIKRQHLQQQQSKMAATQQQVSQAAQLTRLTAAQIISAPQMQQVAAAAAAQQQSGGVTSQTGPVTAAIVKTMTQQPNSVPLSLGISVNMPQQKTTAGKPPQVQAIRFQQPAQPRKAGAGGPLAGQQQQKVTSLQQLQQVAKGATPVLLPPQQQAAGQLHKVMVQQVMVKQPTGQQGSPATLQQIVTTPLQTSVGASVVVSSAPQQVTRVTQVPRTVISSALPGGTSLVSHPGVTLAQGATLVKHVQHVQELVATSPQHSKAITLQNAAVSPQVKAVQQVTTVRQLQPGAQSVQVLQPPVVKQQMTLAQPPATSSTNVQQAVQQVLQQAQSQAAPRQQQQQAGTSSLTGSAASVSPATLTAAQQMVAASVQPQQQQQAQQQGDKSPYATRLRNQRS